MKWESNAKYAQPVDSGSIYTHESKRIKVHRMMGCDGWYLTCNELGFSQTSLCSETFNDAVIESKQLIEKKLNSLLEEYNQFINDDSNNEIVRYL